jgi:hypothetical protein
MLLSKGFLRSIKGTDLHGMFYSVVLVLSHRRKFFLPESGIAKLEARPSTRERIDKKVFSS